MNPSSELLSVSSVASSGSTRSDSGLKPIAVIEPQANVAPAGSDGKFSGVAPGFQHHCVVVNESLKCWGLNRHGQIGNGVSGLQSDAVDPLTGAQGTPQVVTRPYTIFSDGVTGAAVGYEHSCAIHRGTLKCFGSNEYSQLGVLNAVPTEFSYSAPVEVLLRVKRVAARARVTCAVTESNELYCWGTRLVHSGTNLVPQLLSKRPLKIPLENVTHVSMSATHVCAIAGGGLHCWGLNTVGEAGNGDVQGLDVIAPYQVIASGVSDLRLTDGRTCATVDGKAMCFGASMGDRAIDATRDAKWKVPERKPYAAVFWSSVPALEKVSASAAVLAGSNIYHGSFLHNDGKPRLIARGVVDFDFSEADLAGCMLFRNLQVYCWGPNTFGQLGSGTRSGVEPQIYQAVRVTLE